MARNRWYFRKKQVNNSGKYPFWMFFGIALMNLFLAFIPVYNLFIALPVSVIFLALARYKGWAKKPTFVDYIIMVVLLFLSVIVTGALGVLAIHSVPLVTLLVVGIACDVIAFFLGYVPFLGDVLSAGITFIVCATVIGGFWGILLGSVASVIALFPFHIPFSITLCFILAKIIVEALL